jgi:signal transduction histidine kinase
LALFIPLGIFYVWSTVATSRRYAQEVSQQVNEGLAARLVREHDLMVGKGVDMAALAAMLKSVAMTHPDVDLYVLDSTGKVLQASVPLAKLEQQTVSLGPVKAVMGDAAMYPTLGDNPRDIDRPKVFSVAPIPAEGPLDGYLYIVLADEVQDSVTAMVESSTILRLSVWVGLAGLALVFSAAVLMFTLLTRRLKCLASVMMDFEQRNFEGMTLPVPTTRAGDEVADLNRVFYNMAARITEQVGSLRESDRLRRELVANVSHDLRTPLTALQGYLETLQLTTLSDEEKRRYLGIATRHSARLSNLVGELFDLAKLEANAAPVHKERFPLGELVQDVVQKFGLGAEQRGVTLVADVRVRPFVYADVGFLERVLENLIDNALRYTPQGGVVSVSLLPSIQGVTVEVTDTGSGIPAEELPHVFERFYRASRTREREVGAGLGLTISQRMLELHDSQLQVTSEVSVGTTFSFSLPTA